MADFNITGTSRPTPINKRPQSNNFFDFLEYSDVDKRPMSEYLNPKLSTPATDQPIQSLALLKNSTPPLAQPTSIPTMTPSPMGLPMPPPQPEQDDSSNFLGSLIAQGVAGIGTGLMGGSASDIQRSAGMFDSMRSQQASRDRAKLLMDPKSEESKKRRMVFEKALSFKIPDNFSYTDLNDPTVLQGLKGQAEQSRLASMPRQGGGVGGVGKAEKEIKSNQKSIAEYREHVASLSKMEDVINNINKLNRTRIGRVTPDFSTDTEAYSSALDRDAQDMVKALAGPGTLQPEERATYGKLVPTGNTRSELALRQAKDIIISGTKRSLSKMNSDISTGDLSQKDYNALINQYNEQLTKKGVEVNQVINPATGQLVPREKNESELKDGRKVLIDQFGYTWE